MQYWHRMGGGPWGDAPAPAPQPVPFASHARAARPRHGGRGTRRSTPAERMQAELGIREALESFAAVARQDGARVEELAIRRLYDAEDLDVLRSLGGDDADERRATGEYGLGMLARSPVLVYWEFLHLESIRLESIRSEGARATVRLVSDRRRPLRHAHGQRPPAPTAGDLPDEEGPTRLGVRPRSCARAVTRVRQR